MADFLPIRWIISLLGIYACALVYMQRAGISVAIVAMTTPDNDDDTNEIHECAKNDQNFSTRANLKQRDLLRFTTEFDWSETLQGVILDSQFYLYMIVPALAGRITDLFGGKWVAFVGALGPCILSFITPIATQTGGAGALIAIRTLMGAFHGCIYGSMFSLYIKWFPVKERANANAGLSFGGELGNSIMYLLAGWLCQHTEIGWPLVFYVNGLFYIPWMVLWIYYCSNDPLENSRLSDSEFEYIKANVPQMIQKKKLQASWLKILTSTPVLCSMVTKMCAGFGYFLLLTKMPSYLSTIFGIDAFKNGSVSSAATFARGLCHLAAAPLSNWIIQRFRIRSIVVRKIFQSIAMMGPALCLCMITVLGCNSTGVIIFLVGAMLLYGFFTGGEWTTISEYAPNSAGTVYGVASILAFASGVFAPYLTGLLLDSEHVSHHEQWNIIFWITAGIYLFGSLVFIAFATDQQQSWDKVAEQLIEESSKNLYNNDLIQIKSYIFN